MLKYFVENKNFEECQKVCSKLNTLKKRMLGLEDRQIIFKNFSKN